MAELEREAWYFSFVLRDNNEGLVALSKCNELFDLIIEWADKHDYQIGGSFGPSEEPDE